MNVWLPKACAKNEVIATLNSIKKETDGGGT